jgi:UDP-N-acetylmuramoyl-tripeptide--D-alanyl-D-alanine ligase
MGAAIAGLGAARPEGEGRRIAVLGDMLELGELAGRAHLELREPIVNRGIDLVFACGPLMRGLFDALPAGLRGGYAESCEELEGTVLAALRPGDVIMIKGSFAIGMGRLVEALKRPGQARAMGKE